jgi:hypothetical protein
MTFAGHVFGIAWAFMGVNRAEKTSSGDCGFFSPTAFMTHLRRRFVKKNA